MRKAKWLSYYQELQKNLALKFQAHKEIDYGEIIYQSPIVHNVRWLVAAFDGEYNVFLERINYSEKLERLLSASFTWKNNALDFALEMFLVCSGRLTRKDRHSIHHDE